MKSYIVCDGRMWKYFIVPRVVVLHVQSLMLSSWGCDLEICNFYLCMAKCGLLVFKCIIRIVLYARCVWFFIYNIQWFWTVISFVNFQLLVTIPCYLVYSLKSTKLLMPHFFLKTLKDFQGGRLHFDCNNWNILETSYYIIIDFSLANFFPIDWHLNVTLHFENFNS